jgi:pimeloyl-ACP methyl ester carboxylesterase
MPRATVNGVEINYEVSGTGVPALFIHGGFGGQGTTLVPQNRNDADLLPSDKVMTISYDRRSAGQSEYILSDYQVTDLAADARALLAHLNIDKSIIVGSSMGGMVAQQYALDYPQHVEALALINTGTNLMNATPFGPALRQAVKQAAEVGDRAFFESRNSQLRNPPQAGLFGRPTPDAEEQLRQRNEAISVALQETSDDDLFTYSTGMLRNQAAFIGFDYTSRLSEIKMPVCIVHGNSDTVVPFEYGQALHRGISQSELFEIEDADHGVLSWPDAADAFREWVLSTISTAQTVS